MRPLSTFIFVAFLQAAAANGCRADAQRCIDAAKKWAPKIYMNSKEQFWPGDADEFLKHVQPKGDGCPANAGIPTGENSKKCFLTTNEAPYELLKDENSYLYGVKPKDGKIPSVPAYVSVSDCGGDHLILAYWIFFPFNRGKDMCNTAHKIPGLKERLNCDGEPHNIVGDHVGDWEHLSVQIRNGQPDSLFLSVHDGGIYYNYDQPSNTFTVISQLKEDLIKVPHPPSTVSLDGDHPILYSALGSHAVWGAAGEFSYSRVELDDLVDIVDQGPEWRTWDDLKVFFSKETTPQWWTYDGRWGNKEDDCLVGGKLCIFSSGPQGLSTRRSEHTC